MFDDALANAVAVFYLFAGAASLWVLSCFWFVKISKGLIKYALPALGFSPAPAVCAVSPKQAAFAQQWRVALPPAMTSSEDLRRAVEALDAEVDAARARRWPRARGGCA